MYCIEHEEGCKAEPYNNACPKCKGIVKVETKEDKKQRTLKAFEERQAKRFNFISNTNDKER